VSELGPLAYLGIFAGSLSLSLLFVPLALRFALRRQVLDHPGGYKQQERARALPRRHGDAAGLLRRGRCGRPGATTSERTWENCSPSSAGGRC
jgi:hypothetical protein